MDLKHLVVITKMDDSKSKIDTYCEAHTTAQSDLLYQLERETFLKTLAPQMASGHLQGRLLTILCQLIQPKIALEIGTGYSLISSVVLSLLGFQKVITVDITKDIQFSTYKKQVSYLEHPEILKLISSKSVFKGIIFICLSCRNKFAMRNWFN